MMGSVSIHPAAAGKPAGAAAARVRPLSPHAPQLHEHLMRLDEADRLARLGRCVAAPAVEAYCTRSRVVEPIIVGGFVDGTMVGSAELFTLPEEPFGIGRSAQVADLRIAVEPAFRGRGLALAMAEELVRYGAGQRIALIRIDYEPENRAMARIGARLGAVRVRGRGAVRVELCTGWLGEGLVPIPAERQPGYRRLW